jgi:hypothetical protein
MKWQLRVTQTIEALGLLSGDILAALSEWVYTGVELDLGPATGTCGLCDHKHLRYQYLVYHRLTKKYLWVGSSCVTNFNMSTHENGKFLDGDETVRKIKNDHKKLVEYAKKHGPQPGIILISCSAELEKFAGASAPELLPPKSTGGTASCVDLLQKYGMKSKWRGKKQAMPAIGLRTGPSHDLMPASSESL